MPLCKCGCGINGKKEYRRGHNNKTMESKQRLSIFAKERYKKEDVWNKGRKMSQEFKDKISNYMKTDKNPSHRQEIRQKISKTKKGRPLSESHLINMRIGCKKPERIAKLKLARVNQKMPLRDTIIEKRIQRILDNHNIRYETHKAIFGQPDIFIEPNICIFIDGCYWHRCPIHYPNSKHKNNDDRTNELKRKGYHVLRIWEHNLIDRWNTNFTDDGVLDIITNKKPKLREIKNKN